MQNFIIVYLLMLLLSGATQMFYLIYSGMDKPFFREGMPALKKIGVVLFMTAIIQGLNIVSLIVAICIFHQWPGCDRIGIVFGLAAVNANVGYYFTCYKKGK